MRVGKQRRATSVTIFLLNAAPLRHPNVVLRTFRILITIACALYLSGAHWMAMQATAWTGMLFARSQRVPVVVAVETTFDGQHPCRLCNAISTGQKDEQQKDREFPAMKKLQEAKFVAVERFELPVRERGEEVAWPEFVELAAWRAGAPPTLPPRG